MAERLPYIDNLKGFLILLVVIGHLSSYSDVSECKAAVALSNFIYTFHMPLFLFCSGLFVARSYENSGRAGSWGGQIATALSFVVIYVLFRVAGYLVTVSFGGAASLNLAYMGSGAWYLFVLACFLLISPVISKIRFSWALGISLLLSVANAVWNQDQTFLSSSRFFTYLPWFVLGYYCTGRRLIKIRQRLSDLSLAKRGTVVMSAVLLLVAYYLALYVGLPVEFVHLERQLSTGLHTAADIEWVFGFEDNAFLVALVIARLLHYVLVALVCLCAMAVCPVRSLPMTKWGKNSLQVYLVHLLVLYGIQAAIGLDAVAGLFGIKGDMWDMFFPVFGGIVFVWILAISNFPNRWLASLKNNVKNFVLIV